MTKEQKFEARLQELGLTQEWENQGRLGRVATTDKDGKITLLVHEIWQADSARFDTEVRNTEAFRDLERVLEGDFEDVFVEW